MSDQKLAMSDDEMGNVTGGWCETTVKEGDGNSVYCVVDGACLNYNSSDANAHYFSCPECGEYYYKSKWTNKFYKGFIKQSVLFNVMYHGSESSPW